MRVLIMSDSLALAREKPEKVLYEETWPVILKKNGFEIHQVSIGGATSEDLIRQVFYHKNFLPDIVIVQVGIVDCAPRHFTQLEIQLLNKLPFFGKRVLNFFNKPLTRKIRKVSFVSPKRFGQNIGSIKVQFNNSKVFFIGIIPGTLEYEKILPGVIKSIDRYNHILKELCADMFVDLYNFPSSGLMSDFHHINAYGHKILAQKLIEIINK